MVYNPNIPAAGDKLRVSQGQILENFSQADTLFDVDHVKFSDTTGDAGKHTATTFVNRTDKALTIPPTTSAQELAFYVKDDAAGTPRIFYQEPDSAGAGAEQQLSGSIVKLANGETPLPGGLSMKWISQVLINNIGVVFNYNALGLTDFTTSTFNIQWSALNGASGATRLIISSVTNSGFTVTPFIGGVATDDFDFLIIGQ
jgi:hypothetical protein